MFLGLFVNMIFVIILWVCFIQHVMSKVIIVNNNGNSSNTCCGNGTCLCNSLYEALLHIESNTIVNITSKSVVLEQYVSIEIKSLNNVTIRGSNAMVMCNNKGSVYSISGYNILIEGITWDECGDPMHSALKFVDVYNLSIIRCTFQFSKACKTVELLLVEESDASMFIYIINSTFTLNKLEDLSDCLNDHGTLLIRHQNIAPINNLLQFIISRTTFQYNGNQGDKPMRNDEAVGVVLLSFSQYLHALIEHSIFSSNDIRGMSIHSRNTSKIIFNNITVFNNSEGGIVILSGMDTVFDFMSSSFIENRNGALFLSMDRKTVLNFNEISFLRNKGTFDLQLSAVLYIYANSNTTVNLFHCYFDHNIANGGDGMVYIINKGSNPSFGRDIIVSVCSSSFVNNELGSALHISQVTLKFCSSILFQSNSAESGAAMYVDHNALITISDESFVQFVNNTALLRGGAIYADLTNCFNNGILFSNFSNFSSVVFINNSARISGNSIYFSISKSCDVERDYNKSDSVAYIPYKLKYNQSDIIFGPAIAASSYRISLCSSHSCSNINENCSIIDKKMLGHPLYFNATVCDYFDVVAETVQFQINCIKCDTKYRLLNSELLVNNRSPDKVTIASINAYGDVVNDTNIELEIVSVLPDNYKQVSARLSLTLSACYNGFIFYTDSQRCGCYNSDGKDIVQCQQDHAEIKLGYWFGIIFQKHTTSLCPINYCDYHYRTETRRNYYGLSREVDDQCSAHRTGVVCSDCKSGYTLAYDSFDCVDVNQCSPGMTALVVALTFLYWILIIIVLFALTYFLSTQISSGYFNGVIYFYSMVDIILASKLYIIDGLFYTVAILSSFAKLIPQFLGKLCLAKGLNAIDQQFIHYSHTLCISFILIGIVITAKRFNKVAFYINRHVTRVTFLFLMLSYTSVTSTSLQLLRGIQFDDVDGVFVYLSPHFKYYTQRHAVYATVALLCGLSITIGLPLLLLTEPFLRKIPVFNYFRRLLDQFQGSYKDKYQWFAANYLLCRLVIMLIAYFGNSDDSNLVYYMQTACVIIVMNHVCFRPYKKQLLNVLDAAILLTMLLVANLNNVDFSESAITGLVYTLIFIPLLLVFGLGFSKLILSFKAKFIAIRYPGTIQR